MLKAISAEDLETIRDCAAKKGYRTDSKIASAFGMSHSTFSKKINGHISFTLEDIRKMNSVLGISNKTISKIFLGE